MNKIYYEKPKHLQNREQYNNSRQSGVGQKMESSPHIEQEKLVPQKRGIRELIANGILIALSMALVVNIIIALNVIGDMNYSYARDEENFWYSINDGNYAPLIADVWTNRFSDIKETDGLEQCYAVAEYFEAASLYKAADYTGNAEKKEKYAKIMEEKLAYFDDIMYIAEDINMKLGIE